MGDPSPAVRWRWSTHSCLAILVLLYLATCAPAPASSRVVGSVEELTGNELQLRSGAKAIALHLNGKTTVHEGRRNPTVSSLRIGDEVSVSYRTDDSGRLVADTIWAKVVAFRAVVHSVTPTCFDILTHHDADPESAYRKGYSRVFVYPGTKYSTSRQDLVAGRDVHIVGLEVGGGNIDALRVAIYNTDLPRHG